MSQKTKDHHASPPLVPHAGRKISDSSRRKLRFRNVVASSGSVLNDSGLTSTGGAGAGSSTPDAGACSTSPSDAGAACNTVIDVAADVTVIAGASPMPVGTGGAVADGRYVLTGATTYSSSRLIAGAQLRQTIEICGGVIREVEDLAGAASSTHRSFTIAPVDVRPHVTMTCSTKAGDPTLNFTTYTATPTTLVLFDDDDAFLLTFTRQ